MTVATEELPDTPTVAPRAPYVPVAVALAVAATLWPGGRSPLADLLLMVGVLLALLLAVTRHPSVNELLKALPAAPKWGAKIVVGLLFIGQLWGASAQTFPVVTWTMYGHDPSDVAVVYRFDGVTADGTPVTFTPSAANRTIPAKTSVVVHLRGLARQLHLAKNDADAAQIAEHEDALRRSIEAFVVLHNERSPEDVPVLVEVSRVVYDTTQERVPFESGDRTLLLQVELEAP